MSESNNKLIILWFWSDFILMAGTYDNEQQRLIDRIKCIVFREVRDPGATSPDLNLPENVGAIIKDRVEFWKSVQQWF